MNRALLPLVALALVSCTTPPAMMDADAGVTGSDAGPFVLPDYDGTPRLTDCASGAPSVCGSAEDWAAGRWYFHFVCPITSRWQVILASETAPATLEVLGSADNVIASSLAPGLSHDVSFTSLETPGACVAVVVLPTSGQFDISIVQIEPALDDVQCDELCISDAPAGYARGCDCDRTCHDACGDLGTDCGLPCNRDVSEYECPFLEATIELDEDCTYYEGDTDAFEHRGRCYRCGTGQQCCYTDGHDNGTGSFDLCPPLDPGPSDPDPHDCSGPFEHCDCDVTPLCACMAQSGNLALCGECIGESGLDVLSCNAPGDDATFCQRAVDAFNAGFDWCARVGDVTTCTELPPGF